MGKVIVLIPGQKAAEVQDDGSVVIERQGFGNQVHSVRLTKEDLEKVLKELA